MSHRRHLVWRQRVTDATAGWRRRAIGADIGDPGVAAEVDSRAYHISPADQDRDAARHDKLVALGVLVQHFSPRRIRTDGQGVIADLGGAIASGRRRPRLAIIALPENASFADAAPRPMAGAAIQSLTADAAV